MENEIYEILKDEHPALRVVCKLVKNPSGDYIKEVVSKMKSTMEEAKHAVGLAANQVGLDIQVIVVRLNGYTGAMINPTIVKRDNKIVDMSEQCLSVPDKEVNTCSRNKNIRVKFINEDFEEITLKFKGLDAVIVQHEIDHLLGKLITDYL